MTALPTTHTVADVAASLGVSEWFVRDRVKHGVVRPLRVGDRRNAPMRFTAADVEQLVESLRPPEPAARTRRRRRA